MISWLKGHIVDKQQPGKLVINVHGVGYEVETSLSTFFKLETIQTEIEVFIHMIVREDAMLLYGFIDPNERSLFRALIKVNGVGPKLAITILSSVLPEEFIQAIQLQDAKMLAKIPGIGKKTAERLVVEMKGGLKNINIALDNTVSINHEQNEAIEALEALGYKYQQASIAVKKIADNTKNCEQLIREALQVLAV